jgi:hypothetical protein
MYPMFRDRVRILRAELESSVPDRTGSPALTIGAITPADRAQWRKMSDRKKILKPDGGEDFGRRTVGVFGPPLPQKLQSCGILLVEAGSKGLGKESGDFGSGHARMHAGVWFRRVLAFGLRRSR